MIVRHWLAPVMTFAGLTAWWLLPILANPSVVIPSAADNVTFVWNVWWMRYVLQHSGQRLLLHAISVSSVRRRPDAAHAHGTAGTLVAATSSRRLSPAQNLLSGCISF